MPSPRLQHVLVLTDELEARRRFGPYDAHAVVVSG